MMFTFTKARPYAFFYGDAHLVLWKFDRDGRRDLYVIHEGEDGTAVLEYPGEMFTERVLDEIGDVFFLSVPGETRTIEAALGAVFEHGGRRYGAYYDRAETPVPTVWFFRIDGDAGSSNVKPLDENEHREISEVFVERYGEVLRIGHEVPAGGAQDPGNGEDLGDVPNPSPGGHAHSGNGRTEGGAAGRPGPGHGR
ncbi:MAG: hypothetical protein QJR01_00030 [Kyrpidia sp.]|nr:hypothetical protein [Kyrpidia sp.]